MKAESNPDAERSRRPHLSNFRSGISDHIEQCGLHGKIATETIAHSRVCLREFESNSLECFGPQGLRST
jgi:hypothetical protein